MALFSHRRRDDDRWLEWKVRLFSVAAVLTLGGIYLNERWITGAAIVVLAGGLALRFLPGADTGVQAEDDDELDTNGPGGDARTAEAAQTTEATEAGEA